MSIINLKGKNQRGEETIYAIDTNEVASYPLASSGDCVVYFHPKVRKPPIIIDREEHQKLWDAINVDR